MGGDGRVWMVFGACRLRGSGGSLFCDSDFRMIPSINVAYVCSLVGLYTG